MKGIFPNRLKAELKCLKPIIERYLFINENLAKGWIVSDKKNEKDVPWWYNERANLSLFSGAVWLKGGSALEEYAITKKRYDKKKRERISYSGRNDLYFELSEKDYFIVEAKQSWSNNKDDIIKEIRNACKEVRKNAPWGKKLAMIFVVPSFSKKDDEAKMKQEIKDFIFQCKSISCSIIAWAFPEKSFGREKDNGYSKFYPGVILFIKHVK